MSAPATSPIREGPVIHWLWAAVWGALFAGILLATADISGEGCWFYLNPRSTILTVAALVWLWLVVFFGLKNWGRVVLIVCTLLAYAAMPTALRSRISAEEASAVGTLRTYYGSLQSYKAAHPQEGYPEALPNIQLRPGFQHFYTLTYFPSRSKLGGGPNDGFRLEVVPRQMRCGFQRSFTIFEDGIIHFTSDTRPAGKSDSPI